jgi:hypothetical protein
MKDSQLEKVRVDFRLRTDEPFQMISPESLASRSGLAPSGFD